MCQMSVVVDADGVEEMVMENVTRLQVSGTTIEVEAFLRNLGRLRAASFRPLIFWVER